MKVTVQIEFPGVAAFDIEVEVSDTWKNEPTMNSTDEIGWAVREWLLQNYEYDIKESNSP